MQGTSEHGTMRRQGGKTITKGEQAGNHPWDGAHADSNLHDVLRIIELVIASSAAFRIRASIKLCRYGQIRLRRTVGSAYN